MVFVALLCAAQMIERQTDYQKNYPYDTLLSNNDVQAEVRGTFYQQENTEKSQRLYLKNVRIRILGQTDRTFHKMIVYYDKETVWLPGNIVCLSGALAGFEEASNPGQFDIRAYYREQDIYYQLYASEGQLLSDNTAPLQAAAYRMRKRFRKVIDNGLPAREAGLIKAMLLGERTELSNDLKKIYQANGIGHLLAISGLHISILCMALYRFLLACHVKRFAAIPVTISFLMFYGFMTGFGVSTSRATVMMVLYLLADLLRRSYDLPTALAVSACIILFQKPYAMHSCSFLLSYGSVLGIGIFTPILRECLYGDATQQRRRRRLKRRAQEGKRAGQCLSYLIKAKEKISQSLQASVCVQLTTIPLLLLFYYELPVYGIFLNLIVCAVLSFLLTLSGAACLVGLFCPTASTILFGGAYVIIRFYDGVTAFFMKLPGSVVILGEPAWWQIMLYYVILVTTVLYGLVRTHGKSTLVIWACAVILLLFPMPKTKLEVTFLDVGQGDGIYLQIKNGMNFLVDGGSTDQKKVGTYRIVPFLKSKGIAKLDYMIMTHADKDHISGQLELLEQCQDADGVSVGCLLLPKPSEKWQQEQGYVQMVSLAKQQKVRVCYLHTGMALKQAGCTVRCLHPAEGYEAESANAYSTTLEVRYGKSRLLLCGDLEGDGEQQVIDRISKEKCSYSVLKVAHHGSKNSTSQEFLDAVKPKTSVISCGKNNRYGHPHRELLQRLQEKDSKIVYTMYGGAMTFVSDGERETLWAFRKKAIE